MKTVNIKGTIEMTFDQQINVTDEQFELLKDLDVEDVSSYRDSKKYYELEGLIDMADMLEIADEFENVSVTEL